MKLNIDLGSKPGESSKLAVAETVSEPYYPSFHYDGDKPLDLPKKGKMVIEYVVRSETESTRDGGKEQYSCTIDVKKIVSAEGSDKPSPGKSYTKDTEDALDKLAKKRSDEEDEE